MTAVVKGFCPGEHIFPFILKPSNQCHGDEVDSQACNAKWKWKGSMCSHPGAHLLSGVGVSSCDGELTVSQQQEHKLMLGLRARGLVARMCLSVTFSVLFGSIQLFRFDSQGYGGMSSAHLPFIH